MRAAAAAARQLQTADPPRATQLYERVLALRPTDREASDALAELYAAGGRWEELQRLLHARLAGARDDGERLKPTCASPSFRSAGCVTRPRRATICKRRRRWRPTIGASGSSWPR